MMIIYFYNYLLYLLYSFFQTFFNIYIYSSRRKFFLQRYIANDDYLFLHLIILYLLYL